MWKGEFSINISNSRKRTRETAGLDHLTEEQQQQQQEGMSLFRKDELTRLLIQSLQELGYEKSALELENESKILLKSNELQNLEELILSGKWNESKQLISKILKTDNNEKINFLIDQQEYLEYLLDQNHDEEALNKLQQISSYNKKENLSILASFIVCDNNKCLFECVSNYLIKQVNREAIKKLKFDEKTFWNGQMYRKQLMENVGELLPPNLMVPKSRLDVLLNQASQYQILLQQTDDSINITNYDQLPLFTDIDISLQEEEPNTKELIITKDKYKSIQILKELNDEIWSLSSNENYLVGASKDGIINFWNIESNNEFKSQYQLKYFNEKVPNPEPIQAPIVKINPVYNKHVLVSFHEKVYLFHKFGTLLKIFSHHISQITEIKWSKDGTSFVTASIDKHIAIYNLKDCKMTKLINIGQRPIDFVLLENNEIIILTANGNLIQSTNSLNNEILTKFESSNKFSSISLSSDGKKLLCASKLNLSLFDVDTGNLLHESFSFKTESKFLLQAKFIHQDELIALASDNGILKILNPNLNLLYQLKGHVGTINDIQPLPSPSLSFASASDDSSIRIWAL